MDKNTGKTVGISNLRPWKPGQSGNLNGRSKGTRNLSTIVQKLLADENIDIYKDVYVAASEDDYDGDGIDNNQDPCFFIEPAGQDYDQDGIDDACDGTIGQPPPVVEPTAEEQSAAASENSENQQPITVLSSTTNNQSQPPAASTQEISTVDVFSPENNGKKVEAQVQSAATTTPAITTGQDSSYFFPKLGTLKQQWPLLAAISMAAVTSLGLLWKYAVRIGV